MKIEYYLAQFDAQQPITLVGPFAHSNVTLQEPVIFIDSGSNFRISSEGLSVGDGDSYSGNLDVQLNPAKDFSDLAYVLNHIPPHFSHLILSGFLGGRKDHEMFNLGEAHRFLQCRSQPGTAKFDDIVIGYSKGYWQFEHHDIFSIAAIERTQITLNGDCQYCCKEKTEIQPLSSLGLSNVASGTIYLQCDGPIFVYLQSG